MNLEVVFTPALMRGVYLRPGTSDRQVWADTFTGLYHLPPPEMPVPSTVLDLGANIGLTAAHYQALWPDADVLAVEMDRGNAALIERNAPDVRLKVLAVSAVPGLAHYESSGATDAFALGTGALSSPTLTVVRARTLRQIILRGFDERGVDFVKMDVEGTEWTLFEAGEEWAPLVRNLLIELHGGDLPVERGLSALRALGFDARPHPPHPQAVYAWR